jgi:hypothetical protein
MLTTDHRFDCRASIDMLLNKFVAGMPHACRATNISRGGLLVCKLLEPERQGVELVGLQFQLPGQDEIITASGQVIYSHPWIRASGIRFISLADDHRKLIDRYILEQATGKSRRSAERT